MNFLQRLIDFFKFGNQIKLSMKNTALFLLFLITAIPSKACVCEGSERNFYRNLSSDKTIMLVVFEGLSIGNEYDERIEQGSFRLIELYNTPITNLSDDIIIISGNNGSNCGEYLNWFNIGDTLFLATGFSDYEEIDPLFLEGCNTNYLIVKDGKCKGLPLDEVIQKIHHSIDQRMRCGCGFLEFAYDFYSNVKKNHSFCFAKFIGYDYSVKWDNRLFQTAQFRVLDPIKDFDIPVNATFTALGENGINCGEMFDLYQPGDSLILALEASPFNPLATDTFLLNGIECGSHSLKLKGGVDHSGMPYNEIKAKMYSIITNNKSFQTNDDCIVYPNPFNSNIIINSTNSYMLEFRLFDINGRLVFKDIGLNVRNKEYSLLSIPNGVYIVEVKTSTGCHNSRIIKTK